MIKDLFLLAIKNIKARKLRNSLTILGIVIGIAAIITLITMSQGLESSVTEQFEKIGANRIFVMAKGGSAFQLGSGLTDDDVKILGFINELEWITPYTTKQTVITFGREKELLTIWGVPYNKIKERWESFGLNIDKGRYPKKSETYAAVIGAQLAQEGFAREIRINNNIEIEEKKFTVVGIFEEIGTPEDDNIIYINGETAQEIFNKENDFSFIDLTVKSAYDPSTIANKIERRLRQSRGIKGSDDADFEGHTRTVAWSNAFSASHYPGYTDQYCSNCINCWCNWYCKCNVYICFGTHTRNWCHESSRRNTANDQICISY